MKNVVLAVSLLFTLYSFGCGGERQEEGPESVQAPTVDPANPIHVAEAFYAEVDRVNLEGAVRWVLPEQQDEFRSAMQAGMPPLPDDYQVVVLRQGDHAEASIAGSGIEVDLQLHEGRWWVTN